MVKLVVNVARKNVINDIFKKDNKKIEFDYVREHLNASGKLVCSWKLKGLKLIY